MIKIRPILGSIVLIAIFSVGFRLDTPSRLTSPVNMYLADSLLFVSDQNSGVHVYSVKDQARPAEKMRIPISNNAGVAVKGDIIYANSGNAILALRMHDDSLYDVVKVINNAVYYPGGYAMYDGPVSCGCARNTAVSAAGGTETGNSGMGGSYAVFAVIDSFLYYIDKTGLVTMDISTPGDPRELSRTYVDWSVETLFPTQKYLFLGGSTGMFILDRKDPRAPVKIGGISHFRSCDPVVVRDSLAYVTLRSGNRCGDNKDELMVVNIADPSNPFVVSETGVPTPYGLAIRDSLLYVAKGANGFALYDVIDPKNPRLQSQWSAPDARDFIWYKNAVYIMGMSNVMIYNADDPNNPRKLATIE